MFYFNHTKNSITAVLTVSIFLMFVAVNVVNAQDDLPEYEVETVIEDEVLSLDECVRFAVGNSFEVKLAKLDLLIAETDLMYSEAVFDTFMYGGLSYSEDKRQQTSVFAPNDNQTNEYYAGIQKKLPTGTELDAKFGDVRSWSNTAFVSKNPSHTAELSLEAKQPIGKNFFGYVDRLTVSITKLAIKNARLDTKDRIEGIMAEVEKAYLDLVFAEKSLDIHNGILERARELYQKQKKNYDIGLIEKVDLLATEANVATRESEVLIAKNDYARAEASLKLMMNFEIDRRIVPSKSLTYSMVGENIVGCLKEAFENRRDYYVDKRDVEISGLDLKIKKNQVWPEIDLTATIATNGVDPNFDNAVGKTTTVNNMYYYGGIEFTVPIENKAARSEALKAKYEKEKALVAIKETERTIITEVGTAFNDLVAYSASVKLVKKAEDLEYEKLVEEEKRFGFGRSNIKRLIDYQQDYLRAQMEEALALLKYRKAKVDLARSMNVILAKYEDIL